mmetsp:Transcript_35916/g.56166  ORF Transcript_35916/g.56166 Transcript_35916/m.56166 type:complete len:169 (-) Transcript_35916:143-649(-)
MVRLPPPAHLLMSELFLPDEPIFELQREVIEGHTLLIIQCIDKRYLRYFVGVEMAKLLRQQTYNMYRSMKSRGIKLIRANQSVLSFLRQQKAVHLSTHSVTLVPYTEGMKYILERLLPPTSPQPTIQQQLNPQLPQQQIQYQQPQQQQHHQIQQIQQPQYQQPQQPQQ